MTESRLGTLAGRSRLRQRTLVLRPPGDDEPGARMEGPARPSARLTRRALHQPLENAGPGIDVLPGERLAQSSRRAEPRREEEARARALPVPRVRRAQRGGHPVRALRR